MIFLPIVDRQAEIAVTQTLLGLIDADFLTTKVAEVVLPSIAFVHSIAFNASLNKATVMANRRQQIVSALTPEKLPVFPSRRAPDQRRTSLGVIAHFWTNCIFQ
ncbi:hypothetical protein [Mesorhizobium silamurunense]|uniref:hypothetical protein n=1 Tax=Mesorhizobium silamurunense TaxID=499528 RepID=UPI00177F48BD|nr:hypothetical protein [Mesorhizobium silamurunense]